MDANKNKTNEGITGTMSGHGFDVGTSGYDVEAHLVSWERDDGNLDTSWNRSLVRDSSSYTENANAQNRTHGGTHELPTVAGQAVTHPAKGSPDGAAHHPVLSVGCAHPTAVKELVQFFDFAFRQISTWCTSPETKFGER
ncbi:hypothetical protein [Rhodopirellula sp. P2]|uniref:hypothetical protein n=1 Tax=Rhodopirellula sp. P2 TaxID=2127060 RepID=UPI00236868F0|nr:hypothetical protein [Rhodopirellula sp. P2]WDQ15114.1 hypothetical protein PSR62_15870 [Rhodopirellula sp. P2]